MAEDLVQHVVGGGAEIEQGHGRGVSRDYSVT
jgi:hypothetical protein